MQNEFNYVARKKSIIYYNQMASFLWNCTQILYLIGAWLYTLHIEQQFYEATYTL
jgi:hypothetical protein